MSGVNTAVLKLALCSELPLGKMYGYLTEEKWAARHLLFGFSSTWLDSSISQWQEVFANTYACECWDKVCPAPYGVCRCMLAGVNCATIFVCNGDGFGRRRLLRTLARYPLFL